MCLFVGKCVTCYVTYLVKLYNICFLKLISAAIFLLELDKFLILVFMRNFSLSFIFKEFCRYFVLHHFQVTLSFYQIFPHPPLTAFKIHSHFFIIDIMTHICTVHAHTCKIWWICEYCLYVFRANHLRLDNNQGTGSGKEVFSLSVYITGVGTMWAILHSCWNVN